MYHTQGNVISATVGLVCINPQPEARLVSDNYGSLEKMSLGLWVTVLPSHPKQTVYARCPN